MSIAYTYICPNVFLTEDCKRNFKKIRLEIRSDKMRKIVNIFLVFLLLFSTTGIAVSKHFCGEILQSVTINSDKDQSCCDSQDMPEDCCSSELSLEKADEVQLSQLHYKFAPSSYIIPYIASQVYNFSSKQVEVDIPVALFNSPPLIDQEIFILDQSFLL